MDDLKSKGVGAFFWDFFGKIARHGTTFIVTIFLARLLEPSDFGLIAMVMVIVMVAFVFTDVGLGGALIQRRRVLPVHFASVFYFNLLIGALLTLITLLSAGWISGFYGNPRLIPLIQAISPLFVINAFGSIQTSKLRKELDYAALTKAEVSSGVLSGAVSILLAWGGAGVWSLAAQVLMRALFYDLFVWYSSRWVPSFSFSFKALKQLWGFGFRMFLSALLETIYSKLDVMIIGKLFSPAVLGFFDQARRLDLMVTQLSSGSFVAVLFPVLSKVQNNLPRFQTIVIKTLGIISFVTFFLLGIMYLVSEELIVLLFSDKWLPSAAYFKILVLGGFAYPVSALLVNILTGRGNSKAFLRLEIYKKILLTVNLFVGFLWGIEGYLYGLAVAGALSVGLNILFASREIRLPFWVLAKPVVTQMAIAAAAVGIVSLLPNENYGILLLFFVKSISFAVVYVVINRVLRTSSYEYFSKEAIQIVSHTMKKG